MEKSVDQINVGARKTPRKRRSTEATRLKKYQDKDPQAIRFIHPCTHTNKKFKCLKITRKDVVLNRKLLYKNQGLQKQNLYLTRLISAGKKGRDKARVTTAAGKQKAKSFVSTFLLIRKRKATTVCKKLFTTALGVSNRRVLNLSKVIFRGEMPKENRGGDRKLKKNEPKKEAVEEFIGKFKAVEIHYGRNKSCRIYLSCELNLSKMLKMYNESVEPSLQVERKMFTEVFKTKFNIGFSTPSSDVCTYCTLIRNQLALEKQDNKKQELRTKLRIHKLRTKQFYAMMRNPSEKSLYISFDLQQVHPLPKTPIQEAFYSRQISFYTFCIVKINTIEPYFYCWTEDQSGRGSTEVASALLSYLNSQDLSEIENIRMFADGCGGQNKNNHVMQTLMFWLDKKSPSSLKEIELVFPVRGHSFLPADRVFGRVEKFLKKKTIITTKDQYEEVYGMFGTVKKLGTDWDILNVKTLLNFYKKVNGIQDIKRIILRKDHGRCKYKVYGTYRFQTGEEQLNDLLKPRRSVRRFELKKVALGKTITETKKKDAENLLQKQFGNNWQQIEELSWYVSLLTGASNEENVEEDSDSDNGCNCDEEESEIFKI